MTERNISMTKRNIRIISNLLLLLTALIWGAAFVAQSVGMNYVGPWTFVFTRFILASIVLYPVTRYSEKIYQESLKNQNIAADRKIQRKTAWIGGACCGCCLGIASISQQIGMQYTTAGKAGFITALYVIIVPFLGMLFGKRPEKKIWFCALLGIIGLYLISMKAGAGFTVERGDMFVILCAVIFSLQIMSVDHFSQLVNPVRLSNIQFLFSALIGFVGMLLFEHPTIARLWDRKTRTLP